MPNTEIELDPIDFITIGTIGPKGRRQFNIQAGQSNQIVTLTIEKEQARQLAEAINDILNELGQDIIPGFEMPIPQPQMDMELRDPVEPQFRVAKMGLGYDQTRDMLILVAQELIIPEEPDENLLDLKPSVARFWGTRAQYRALSEQAYKVVDRGRPEPGHNGHVIYYWT